MSEEWAPVSRGKGVSDERQHLGSRRRVPATLEYKDKKKQPPPPGVTVHEEITSVKLHTADTKATATWHGATGKVAAERQCLHWESGGGEGIFWPNERARKMFRQRGQPRGREDVV